MNSGASTYNSKQTATLYASLRSSMTRFSPLLYLTLFQFLIRYRKTMLGPIWLLVGPAIFITLIGILFAQIGARDPAIFIPHLAVGLIVWSLISGIITDGTTVFQRGRAQILQGGISLTDMVMVSVLSNTLTFLHQIILIFGVFIFFKIGVTSYSLISIAGLFLLTLNGIWVTVFFGIIGARYRDLSEVVRAIIRVAFLATPIIWMPGGAGGRSGVLGIFLNFNPFYHFIELVRAPLLGNAIAPLSWIVVITITLSGFIVAIYLYRRFAQNIALWV